MVDKTFFRVFSGLMTPEHQQRIGNALWVFLWMIDRTTKDETGAVYYGNPVSYSVIGDELGIDKSTVRRYCETLAKAGYISMKRTTRGYKYHVMKSKKWGDVSTTDGTIGVKSDTEGVKNSTRNNKDRVIHDTDGVINDTEGVKTGHSILKDNINNNLKDKEKKEKEATSDLSLDSESMKQEILNEYIRLRGTGFLTSPADAQAADELVQENVSLSDIKQYMQECFHAYQPKHRRDRINTLSYCVGFILDRHHQEHLEVGQAALDLANQFLAALKKLVPNITEPNIKQWATDMQHLLDKGNSVERIKEIMTFARNDSFWSGHTMNPAALAKNFDRFIVLSSKKGEPRKANERKDQLPKWLKEEKEQTKEAPTPTSRSDDDKSFEEMLEELRASKQKPKEGN